ncbi:MAG: type II secretion system protein [Planctomycetota bacterium]
MRTAASEQGQDRRRFGRRATDRRGFTLIELLVVIAIIALLIGILLPALGRARQSAQTLQCLSNIRQLSISLNQYANDFKSKFPPNDNDLQDEFGNTGVYWYELPRIGQYLPQQNSNDAGATLTETVGGGIMTCPNHPEAGRSYTMNFFASSGVEGGTRPRRAVPGSNTPMRGFDATATFSSKMFVIAEAWGRSYVEPDENKDDDGAWFTTSTIGAETSSPFERFGGGDGISDVGGAWTGGGRTGAPTSPEFPGVGEAKSYIPYYRHPKDLSDTGTFEGRATFGFVDGHASDIGFSDLVNESTRKSAYRAMWSAEDQKVERDPTP